MYGNGLEIKSDTKNEPMKNVGPLFKNIWFSILKSESKRNQNGSRKDQSRGGSRSEVAGVISVARPTPGGSPYSTAYRISVEAPPTSEDFVYRFSPVGGSRVDSGEDEEVAPLPSGGGRLSPRRSIGAARAVSAQTSALGLVGREVQCSACHLEQEAAGPTSMRQRPGPSSPPQSPTRRRRRSSRRRRRRRRRSPASCSSSDETMYEVEDVEYEPITEMDVARSRRGRADWRVCPVYRLNSAEVAHQEAELYRGFKKEEERHETVVPVKEGEIACCVCYENRATRVVIPCGHLCLCYDCALNIAFNRTLFYGSRVAKLCPICQAAIAIMPKLC